MTTPRLSVEGVDVSYGGLVAVSDVSFSVQPGEIMGIAGANGAGKSSLLRAIAGVQQVSRGKVTFENEAVNDADLRKNSVRANVLRGIALVPEGRRLFAGLSVEDHLRFGAYLVGSSRVQRELDRVYSIFPKLAERRTQDVNSLSGGEKQMVAIGRGLMARPKLLMIDELSLGLAPVVVNSLIDALLEINRGGDITLLLVDECLGRLGSHVSRVLFLSHGRVQRILSPEELKTGAAALYLTHEG